MLRGIFGHYIHGMPIYENHNLTESQEYQEEVVLSFRKRWIDPILHPVVLPFQPWVRTKNVTKVRQVPASFVYKTQFGFIMHPDLKKELTQLLSNTTA